MFKNKNDKASMPVASRKLSSFSRDKLLTEHIPMLTMLAPFLIFFFMFTIIPIFASIGLSFTSYDMISNAKFIGIENYRRMIVEDTTFSVTVRNTLIFAIIAGPLGFLLSFVLAWFVNEFTPKVRAFLSFMFYAPSLVGNAYFIWKVAFSGDSYGYINSFLLSLGIITQPIVWLKTEAYLMTIVIIVQLWQSMGVSFLSNISGLQNVSRDMYEAGAIDGIRNRWQELRYITLPAMQPMLLFSAVMQIQSSFSASTIMIELAGYPSKGNAVDTIVSLMTDMATVRYELGYACAMSVVLFVMMVAARLLVGKLLKLFEK
ncbi:MAG: sugar ABC transporter permease [Ruminococcaceae bacterium]|nr:sugar ABC transporter permease [Oscillospiraceae bacterium]